MAEQARFLSLPAVAEELAISMSQAYALVRTGDLPAVKIGGRGQWRVERTRLEDYITRLYAETERFIAANPVSPEDLPAEDLPGEHPAGRDASGAVEPVEERRGDGLEGGSA